MKYKVLLIAGLLLVGSIGFADEASKLALAEDLMTVMDIRGQMAKSLEVMKRNLPAQMAQSRTAMGMSAQPSNELSALDKAFDTLFSGPEWDNVQKEMAGIYAEVFTEEELKGLADFYRSPIGKAYLDKQPEVMQKSMKVHQKMMMGIMPKLQAIMKESHTSPSAPAHGVPSSQRSRESVMTKIVERNLGPQPLAALMTKLGLEPHDLVAASGEQLTHKMVTRACRGRWLTPNAQAKVLRALNRATGQSYILRDLFAYD